ncbi:PfaD family polyunsaturated fatty acid/polyketide biosynthesis protein [Azospirillum sp. B4]|uniref:PfaD family polyunsaturated fatty acid/polyketide biosynthesis protein n=1 Tax=Azospirillum sp. B4 TaxID=95605 RepID=UPI0003448E4C|nr:PfaD family polyunsaturated fatty acid/polyketide biosynthesis protein [Azospirillum sp. B4]
MSIRPEALGAPSFLRAHNVALAYVVGGMVKGIASRAMVERLARARLLGFFGTGGMAAAQIADEVATLARTLGQDAPWGVNFLHNFVMPEAEEQVVDILLRHGVRCIEASAFIVPTPALVRYRLTGLAMGADGHPVARHRIMAKVSRPEVARRFLAAADPEIIRMLVARGHVTEAQAALAARISLADDLCIEADSGGHTDRQVALALVPSMLRLRAEVAGDFPPAGRVRVGAAGGIGAPEAAAAAFVLGADFVLTGSLNQCTVEAATSDLVKDMLAAAAPQDFDTAPAGDMFEIGARVQVLKRGTLFAARANRLHELYRSHASIEDIPAPVLREIEERYFGRSVAAVWDETARHYAASAPGALAEAEANPHKKLAMIFRWYFIHSARLALAGEVGARSNFQIHAGPAMAACNAWLAGTPLADWRRRHVDDLGIRLMSEAADHLTRQLVRWTAGPPPSIFPTESNR